MFPAAGRTLTGRPGLAGAAEGGEFGTMGLREDIRLSWRRSRQASAPMDRMDVPYADPDDDGERLLALIGPMLTRFAEQLVDTRFSLVLAGRDGRVLHTWAGQDKVRRHLSSLSIDAGFVLSEGYAGTNGIGTVLEENRPVVVAGPEHYSEPLRHLVCAGTPLNNPITGRLDGVLDLACPSRDWTQLVGPALDQLRRDVEHELSDRASGRQRLIFERFVARCRETSAALVGLSEHYMITNAAAADLFSAADQPLLWNELADDDGRARRVELSDGRIVDVTSQEIRHGESVTGRLVELIPTPARRSGRGRGSGSADPVGSKVDLIASGCPDRLLVTGEVGTGKTTAATQVHRRAAGDRPLTVHSCDLARIDGEQAWLDELARLLAQPGGTVLLRHVELLDRTVQQTVRALVDRRGGAVRVYATATVAGDGIADGSELWDPIDVASLRIPPLRERRDEIPALVRHVLRDIRPDLHVSSRAIAALSNYEWPSNITQFRSVLAHAADAAGDAGLIGLHHLPPDVAGTLRGQRPLSRIEELERVAIIAALREHRSNKLRAAAALGMSRSTFYRRLRHLGLDPTQLIG